MAYDLGGYVDVPTRLRLALKDWPKLRIQETASTLEQVGEQLFMVCVVTVWRDETDPIPVIASAAEQIPGRTPYTRNAWWGLLARWAAHWVTWVTGLTNP
jgi:hypothetical protein